MTRALPPRAEAAGPITALAPMQDVTTLPFMRLMGITGAPDWFFTEYFRVHDHSNLEEHIVDSILHHNTGRPIFAQMIGEANEPLKRTAKALKDLPIAGIDLNMGCPAPKVYKKNVGGGLLRSIDDVNRVLGNLRSSTDGIFSVKMRIGFADWDLFEALLDCINQHEVDLLSLHGRTVHEGYHAPVHYDLIKQAVNAAVCPVIANGEISSVDKAIAVQEYTGAFGLMIGRSAIRNPWIFRQIHEHYNSRAVFRPRLSDVRLYVDQLRAATDHPDVPERLLTGRMKKFLNFVGTSIDGEGHFLHTMRRTKTRDDLLRVCDSFMIEGENADRLFRDEPFDGVIARPNCESREAANHATLERKLA